MPVSHLVLKAVLGDKYQCCSPMWRLTTECGEVIRAISGGAGIQRQVWST